MVDFDVSCFYNFLVYSSLQPSFTFGSSVVGFTVIVTFLLKDGYLWGDTEFVAPVFAPELAAVGTWDSLL